MSCWICGNDGTTGEHLIKASDLKYYFGNVTTKDPVYFNKDERSWVMQSINSKFVKSDAKICNSCNSDKSQPFDKDWELLSKYIHDNFNQLASNKKIKLSNVFPGRKTEAMLNVHLYFCKLFGCRLAAETTPLKLEPFREAITNTTACDNLFIEIGRWDPKNRTAGISSIQAIEESGKPIVVWWFYIVGNVAVYISFCFKPEIKKLIKNCWHPNSIGKYVSFYSQIR